MVEQGQAGTEVSKKRKALSAVALFFLLIVFVEILPRNLGRPTDDHAFTEYKDGSGRSMVRYNQSSQNLFFTARKPEDVFRIMVFGGRTAMGYPFHYRSSFGLRLAALLEQSLPGRKFEVLHLCKPGADTGELRETFSESLQYSPDLAIVYTGHNELVASRAGQEEQGAMPAMSVKPPPPFSAEEYERIKQSYENNLRRMARESRERGVPLVLCAPASNISAWPPEGRAFPANWSDKQKEDALTSAKKAKDMMKGDRLGHAISMLEKAEIDFEGYALLSFYLGRCRAQMWQEKQGSAVSTSGPGGEGISFRQKALADFNTALFEQARTGFSTRAPPGFAETVRKAAREEGALWLDTAGLFQRGHLFPDFDLFEDHCHPTMRGQQIIAAELARLLQEEGIPAPSAEWKERGPWQEMRFLVSQKVDYEFLHKVRLDMGIFLGLHKHLPRGSAVTRENLQKAYMTDPNDPFPLILETVTAMHYPEASLPTERLSAFYRERPRALYECVSELLTSRADLRKGVFMARVDPHPDRPPLKGYLQQGRHPNKMKEGDIIPRSRHYYNRFLNLAPRQEKSATKAGDLH